MSIRIIQIQSKSEKEITANCFHCVLLLLLLLLLCFYGFFFAVFLFYVIGNFFVYHLEKYLLRLLVRLVLFPGVGHLPIKQGWKRSTNINNYLIPNGDQKIYKDTEEHDTRLNENNKMAAKKTE